MVLRTYLSLLATLVVLSEGKSYDYVVIGGGTGGLAVASRLAEDASITVAVLEAGPNAENLPEVYIPGLIGTGQSFTTLNWAYQTVPQKNLNNRVLTVNAGKALGGSTIINSMIFPRAIKAQYDKWGRLNNDSSWSWSSLLPFFQRSEIFTPPNPSQVASGAQYEPDVHGFDNATGRVKVGFPNYFFIQSQLWRNASGLALSGDLADGDPAGNAGVSPDSLDAVNNTRSVWDLYHSEPDVVILISQCGMCRCSAACAYYTPFASQPNFDVLTGAVVTRIIWDSGSTPLKATGVEYIINNQTTVANVTKEVILSAGTIGSPKILELSGVGNATILQAAGITPVLNLSTVGENLADHVHSWTNAFTNITLTKDSLLLNPNFMAAQLALWNTNRTGKLLSAAPRTLGIVPPSHIFSPASFGSLISQAENNLTYYANLFSNGNPDLANGIIEQHKAVLDLYKQNTEGVLEMNFEPGYSGPTPFASRPQRNFSTINVVLYAPLSRGRTHIVSSSPLSAPAVDPAYWSHPLDTASQVAGINLGRKTLNMSPLDSIYQGEFEPGVGVDSETWLRGVVASDNHETGTLSMMPQELGGVVDTQLRVYGIQNLRVVDASIIPVPISSHLSSTIYAIGEKAADMIKGAM
ncbi:alcohol oxidase [Cyathus striatus]|nr:alcohol oxidase [Cyathus striatus]